MHKLDPARVSAVVHSVKQKVTAHYVFPEKREAMARRLDDSARSGRYRTDDPRELAALVTEDLQAASRDVHMRLSYDPEAFREAVADRAPRQLSQQEAAEIEAAKNERYRVSNHGVEELRILPGNIRYVRISSFRFGLDSTGLVVDTAMRFLNDGDAAIIDIRGTPGGTNYGVQYWASHFFDEPKELLTVYDSFTGEVEHVGVLAHVPAGRFLQKPLAVLINGSTGSAAEAFAYIVQQSGVGTLVGRTTAGAGNTVNHLPVPPGFELIISTGRPVSPVSKSNWEGTGVAPDVDVPSDQALAVAELRLLETLGAKSSSAAAAARYGWALPAARAAVTPVVLTREQMLELAGAYEPNRFVRVERNALVYQREGGDRVVLRPLGNDLFQFGADLQLRLKFEREGTVVSAMEMRYQNGERLRIERKTPATQ